MQHMYRLILNLYGESVNIIKSSLTTATDGQGLTASGTINHFANVCIVDLLFDDICPFSILIDLVLLVTNGCDVTLTVINCTEVKLMIECLTLWVESENWFPRKFLYVT